MAEIFIIAEAGVNHNGSQECAKKMVDAACTAGVNAIKFQTFKTEKLTTTYASKAIYQEKSTLREETQFEMLKKLELSVRAQKELFSYCKWKGILCLSSPFDNESIDFLNECGFEIFKIPSGEITNLPYLRIIGKFNKKLLLSTGMADLAEIEDAIDTLISSGTERNKITILHCISEYPAPYEEVNLLAIRTLREAFHLPVGYSDHTRGIEISIAAAALGATVIEKHFTLDKTMEGPDHSSSLEPAELKMLVTAVRNVEKAMGDGIKKPTGNELKNALVVRKSIVASCDIEKGSVFSHSNLTVKRPGTGISPMEWDRIAGSKATRDFLADEIIEI